MHHCWIHWWKSAPISQSPLKDSTSCPPGCQHMGHFLSKDKRPRHQQAHFLCHGTSVSTGSVLTASRDLYGRPMLPHLRLFLHPEMGILTGQNPELCEGWPGYTALYHPQDMGRCFLWSWSVLIPVTSDIPEWSGLRLACQQNQIQSKILEPKQNDKSTQRHFIFDFSNWITTRLSLFKMNPGPWSVISTLFKRSRNLKCPGLPDLIPLHTIILCLSAHRGKCPSGLGFPSPSENELGKNKPLSFN